MKNMREKIVLGGMVVVAALAVIFVRSSGSSSDALVAGDATTIKETSDVMVDQATAEATTETSDTPESVEVTPETAAASVQPTITSNTNVTSPVVTTPAPSSTYTDGSYTVTEAYKVPDGSSDSITVTIALKDDTVTSLSVTGAGLKRESQQYQSRFIGSIDSQVIGKDIDTISLSRVGGASLTTKAFNNALQKIEAQAS